MTDEELVEIKSERVLERNDDDSNNEINREEELQLNQFPLEQSPIENENIIAIKEESPELKEDIKPYVPLPLKKIEILPPPERGILMLLGFQ